MNTKLCHGCMTNIPFLAQRCPHCTSYVDTVGMVRNPPSSMVVNTHQPAAPILQAGTQSGSDQTGAGFLWVAYLVIMCYIGYKIDSGWPVAVWFATVILAFINLVRRS